MTTTATRTRQQAAYQMRQEGASYHAIAVALGWTSNGNVYPGSARKAVLAEAKRHAFRGGTTRAFGVEIECYGLTPSQAANVLLNAGLQAADYGYSHAVVAEWKVVTDGSLHRYDSCEVVSPILSGEEGFAALRVAVKALKAAGATVGIRTGLHVHHDANDLTADQVARVLEFYNGNRDAINKIVSKSRRSCQWARHYGTAELQSITAKVRNGEITAKQGGTAPITRYKAVNVAAYLKYGTLEFRQHQGSLNADKIIAWVKFGQAVIQAVINGADTETGVTLDEMLDGLAKKAGLDATAVKNLRKQAARLSA